MQANNSLVEASENQPAIRDLDMVLLYPGAIDGGAEQVIIGLIPEVVQRPEVTAWAFERTLEPVPVVALLLDVEADALADVVDLCEDWLSSRLVDDPVLVMPPLVDMPSSGSRENLPWGVRQSKINAAAGAGKLRQHIAQEQAICELALAVLSNVRDNAWDRKTIAPTLLYTILQHVAGEAQVATVAYQMMQHLLSEHPAKETLIRQFRMNAHKLVKADVQILLQGATHDEFQSALSTQLDKLKSIMVAQDVAGNNAFVSAFWKRLAGSIGFTAVEAAYLACLVASNGRAEQ
ncbi:hypothetical protein V8J88_13515 [Massilia sp. W12]|uniref:hypothetical protein n=1 Tax=Massilia sp. W12 TaxID=3126507 RepID=UPI0030CBAD04